MTGGYKSRVKYFENSYFKLILDVIYPPSPFINIIRTSDKSLIVSKINKNNCKILDIGSGLSKGPGKWLWKDIPRKSLTRLDIIDGDDIDIVSDATKMPISDEEFDSIVLQSVPEHVPRVIDLFKESNRVLKINGHLYIEMPFLQGVHGDPSDYWRFTQKGLCLIVGEKYKLITSGVSGGAVGSLIWIFSDLLSNLTNISFLNIVIRFFIRWILSPVRYLDYLLRNSKASKRLACEYYYLFKKIKN